MLEVFVVEDDPRINANMVFLLKDEGFFPITFNRAEDALEELKARSRMPGLMLLDVRLPRMSGVDLAKRLQTLEKLPPTIIVSGEASISETVEALKLGVYDFIEKPFSKERLFKSISNCLNHFKLQDELRKVKSRLQGQMEMLGQSALFLEMKDQIGKVAPTEGRVLIQGESGTGKELVANAIHQQSRRAKHPYIKINCAAMPSQLIEGELFGHVRGAFTGADKEKAGLFEASDKGTLFLDEIGDMPLDLQTRLLRVLEDGRVRRVGATEDRQVDVRVISATHQDLEELVEKGTFRQDLFFRLNTLPISVPSLKQRKDDIPLLCSHFLEQFAEKNHIRMKQVSPQAMEELQKYQWPGNIRELRNLCERLIILGGDPIHLKDLPPNLFKQNHTPKPVLLGRNFQWDLDISLKDFRREVEYDFIEKVLIKNGWNFTRTADALGIHRTYLYQKTQSLGIVVPDKE